MKAEAAKPLLQLKPTVEVQPDLFSTSEKDHVPCTFHRYLGSSFFKFLIELGSFKNSIEATMLAPFAMGDN